jgi:hypothetical protein
MFTMAGVRQPAQHVAFLSPFNPKTGCLPHLHFLSKMLLIDGSLHAEQHVGLLSVLNPIVG